MRSLSTAISLLRIVAICSALLTLPSAHGQAQTATVDGYLRQLSSDSANARCVAIVALEKLGVDAAPAAASLVPLLANNSLVTVDDRVTRESDFAESALRAIGDAGVPALIAGLQHKDAVVRRRGADLLGVFKSPAAVAPLVSALSDKDRNVAAAAAVALSQIGRPSVDALVKLVQDSVPKAPTDADVLAASLIRDTRVDVTADDGSSILLQACGRAIDALGQIDDERTMEPLLQAIGCGALPLQRAAVQALHRRSLIPGGSTEFLAREDVVSALASALSIEDRTTRSTLLALLKRCPRSAMEPVLTALQSSDAELQQAAFDACNEIFDDLRVAEAAMSRLMFRDGRLIDNRSFEGVAAAIRYLANQHQVTGNWHDGAVEKLLTLTRHPNSSVKSSAIMAFARSRPSSVQRDPRVVPAMLKLLQDDSQQWVTGMVLQTLAAVQDRRAVPFLVDMLAERHPELAAEHMKLELRRLPAGEKPDRLAQQLCTTLAAIGDKSAIPELQKRISLNEPFVFEALGELGDRDSVPDFVKQLLVKSSSKELKAAAVHALTACPDSRAIGPLSRQLNAQLQLITQGQALTKLRQNDYRVLAVRALTPALAATMDHKAAQALVDSLQFGQLQQVFGDYDPRLESLKHMGSAAIDALIAVHGDANVDADVVDSADLEWFRQHSFRTLLTIVRQPELAPEQRTSIEQISLSLLKAADPHLQAAATDMLAILRKQPAISK